MQCIETSRLSFAFDHGEPLFDDVTIRLEPGWTGLVGANGSGKTTLARLLAGELEATSGAVRIVPRGARVVLCASSVEREPRALVGDGWRASGRVHRALGDAWIAEPGRADWSTFSPGERKRRQIAAALDEDPDILVVDEPTNHLDACARDVLSGVLASFRGIGVLISHDRALLDRLTDRTLRIHGATAHLYSGGYSTAKAIWDADRRRDEDERAALVSKRRAVERQLADQRREHDGARRSTSARARMKDKNDSDARGMMAKFRAESAEKRLGRTVAVTRAGLERAAAAVPELERDRALGRSFFVDYCEAPRPRVLGLEVGELRAAPGAPALLRDVHVTLVRRDRVELRGPNGSGKSTLIRALIEGAADATDRILYVPQEISADGARDLLAGARRLSRDERGRLLSVVAALGVDPDRLLASSSPSPGEARKLAIASGLSRGVWALVLDEPTNHLDLPSIERLEAALLGFPGALLVVSHDRVFAERVTSVRWELRDERLQLC